VTSCRLFDEKSAASGLLHASRPTGLFEQNVLNHFIANRIDAEPFGRGELAGRLQKGSHQNQAEK
jgi:hypothetical protein